MTSPPTGAGTRCSCTRRHRPGPRAAVVMPDGRAAPSMSGSAASTRPPAGSSGCPSGHGGDRGPPTAVHVGQVVACAAPGGAARRIRRARSLLTFSRQLLRARGWPATLAPAERLDAHVPLGGSPCPAPCFYGLDAQRVPVLHARAPPADPGPTDHARVAVEASACRGAMVQAFSCLSRAPGSTRRHRDRRSGVELFCWS